MNDQNEESGIYYYHADHLGSSSVVTDKNGKFHEHLEYFPYGETWINDRANNENLPYRFTGKELDPETGLYYFGARYYDSKLSRWISADDRMDGLFDTQGANIFSYVRANPVKYIDPDGHSFGRWGSNGEDSGNGKVDFGNKNSAKNQVLKTYKKKSWTDANGVIHHYATAKIDDAEIILGSGISKEDIAKTKHVTFEVISKFIHENNVSRIVISSLYRSPKESGSIPGSSSTSPHTRGVGVDITKVDYNNGNNKSVLWTSNNGELKNSPDGHDELFNWFLKNYGVEQAFGPWRLYDRKRDILRDNTYTKYGKSNSLDKTHRHHLHLTIHLFK